MVLLAKMNDENKIDNPLNEPYFCKFKKGDKINKKLLIAESHRWTAES